MTICDQRGCTARAIREVWFDSGNELWFCGHDADRYFPLPPDVRFDLEPQVIIT